jgi:hypothetical protein
MFFFGKLGVNEWIVVFYKYSDVVFECGVACSDWKLFCIEVQS